MAGTVKQLRLTFKNPDGTWGVSGMNEKNQDEKVYGCLFKLKDYEDTGLDPEQLEEIDKLYLKKCQEVNRLKEADQGRWKLGDTVYAICNHKIVTDIIDRIETNPAGTKISTLKHSWLCMIENAFKTSEEAEQALAERQKQ